MTKNITIYTSNNCAYCVMVKKFLTMKGQAYDEVNVDEQPERRQEAIEISGGAMTTPVTIVTKTDDTKTVTIGYNPVSLSSAIA